MVVGEKLSQAFTEKPGLIVEKKTHVYIAKKTSPVRWFEIAQGLYHSQVSVPSCMYTTDTCTDRLRSSSFRCFYLTYTVCSWEKYAR